MGTDRLTNERATVISRSLFRGAALRGERAVALTRLVVCVVGGIAVPFIFRDDSDRGRAVFWAIEGVIASGVLFSLYAMWRMERRPLDRRFQLSSVAFDCVFVFVFLLGYVISPIEKFEGIPYVGIMGRPIFCVLFLAVIGACVRLSRTVAVFGTTVSAIGLVVLVAIDKVLWGEEVQLMPHLVDTGVLLIGFSLLGLFSVFRLHRLVNEGAGMAIDNERVRAKFGAYVSPEVAELSLLEDEISLGGARQNVAVLFSTLR